MSRVLDLSEYYAIGTATFDPANPASFIEAMQERYRKLSRRKNLPKGEPVTLTDLLSGDEREAVYRQLQDTLGRLEQRVMRAKHGKRSGPQDRRFPLIFDAVCELLALAPDATSDLLWNSFTEDGWLGNWSPYLGDDGKLHVTPDDAGLTFVSFRRYVTQARRLLSSN